MKHNLYRLTYCVISSGVSTLTLSEKFDSLYSRTGQTEVRDTNRTMAFRLVRYA
jgi:hypothetical protein